MQLEIGMSTKRYLPARGTAGFARSLVKGKSRVPAPPPIITDKTLLMFGDMRLPCVIKKKPFVSESSVLSSITYSSLNTQAGFCAADHYHPGGMDENSPTFQRWGLDCQSVQVPNGWLKLCAQSAVHSGLIARHPAVPNVETLGYYRKSLLDKDLLAFCEGLAESIPGGNGLETCIAQEQNQNN